jgi:hypothetical protein
LPLDVDSLWDQLLGYLEQGSVIPVIGSGLLEVETPQGARPYDAYLAERLAERIGVSAADLAPGSELNEIACRYVANRGRLADLYAKVAKLAREDATLPIPNSLLQLASIPNFRLFLTTSFAPFLERALNQVRFNGEPKTEVLTYSLNRFDDLREPISEDFRPVIYHLLGKLCSIPEFALTHEDVLEFVHSLQSEQRLPQKLYREIEDKPVLILGARFNDWLARFFLRVYRRPRLAIGSALPIFIADQQLVTDSKMLEFLDTFSPGVNVFPIDNPQDFVAELHRRWNELLPPAAAAAIPAASPGPPSAVPYVFLSYASEDVVEARRINDALRAASVDTFFDKEGLECGDNWEIKLRKKVEGCVLFIAILSRNVLRNGTFRWEWNCAFKAFERSTAYKSSDPDDVYLIPVEIDGTKVENPKIRDEFREVQWEHLPDGNVTPHFIERVTFLFRKAQLERGVL